MKIERQGNGETKRQREKFIWTKTQKDRKTKIERKTRRVGNKVVNIIK
jgi:hypothetical protein